MEKLNIVCLSTQLWDDPMWTNKQHVMSRLAQRGHNVLYVDPLIRVRMLANNVILKRRYGSKRLLTFEKDLGPNLHLLSPVRFLFSKQRETKFNVNLIRRKLKKLGMENVILWVYDPDFMDYVTEIPHRLLIYDCVDDYASMPKERYSNKKLSDIVAKDVGLTEQADIVFATSRHLQQTRLSLNPSTYYTPNVADFEHNSKALDPTLPIPEDVIELPHPIIGFQGNLSSFKFDFDLIEKIVSSRPNWSFVFVGPTETSKTVTDLSRFSVTQRLSRYPNVKMLGIKPYEQLPAYYKAFDVAIMPNSLNDYNRSSFPLKFFEFLGAGLPVVMTTLPALEEYAGTPGVLVAHSPDEFLLRLDEVVMKGKHEDQAERMLLAKKNSWESKVDNMLGIIEGRLKEEKKR